eukprot:15063581-Alexandrium_andersonii.AAC.1
MPGKCCGGLQAVPLNGLGGWLLPLTHPLFCWFISIDFSIDDGAEDTTAVGAYNRLTAKEARALNDDDDAAVGAALVKPGEALLLQPGLVWMLVDPRAPTIAVGGGVDCSFFAVLAQLNFNRLLQSKEPSVACALEQNF